jgi:trimeric autotransporter adhesin
MKRLFFSVFVTLLFSLSAFAQTEGISFQGLARNAAGEVLVSQKISLRLSILLDTESGAVAYVETRQVTTNPQGIFSLVIGDDTALTKSTIFSSIKWNSAPKFIKVEMDPNGGSSYQSMGTTRLQAVPFAFYAYGVDASNVKGLLPVASGGTGVASISELKTRLGLDNFSNAALDTKVDKVAGKGLSSNDYTTAEKNKLAGITGTNTGDQDLSSYATISQLATKANAADVITSLATKANVADVIISLDTKANASEVTTSLASKVDKEIGKGLSTNDYTTAEKTKLAAITGTNTGQDLSGYATTAQLATKANASDVTTGLAAKANASDVTTSLASKVDKVTGKELSTNDFTTAEKTKLAAITGINTGDQDLSGYATTSQLATKPNASDVTTSLATKENSSNKSNAALGTSTTLYPTQNAVKTYVDAQFASATIADADATTKGKLQLTGDLGGSATSPSVIKLRGTPISSVAPTTAGHVLTYDVNGSATWAAPANSANTISGVVPVANGGTGLSSVTSGGAVYASSSSALTTGTLPLTAGGTGVTSQQAAINILTGTQTSGRYLRSDGTDARLSTIQAADVPTLNQNTTGNAANVTGTVAVANGGTGATTAPAALTALGAAPIASPTFTGTLTAPIYASAPQNLTDAATISWNPASGLNAGVTLGGNRTLSFSTAPASGSYGTLVITQDGTGGRTLTLPSTTNRVLGSTSTTTVALSSAANAKDILNFYFDGTTYFWNIGQGYGTAATITANNLAGGAAGSIPYQIATGATGFLAKGNDGEVLTLASGVPSWTAASATGVTSVGMTTPTGLSVTGSPITSSGTLALSLTSGYAIPLSTSQANWDAAYTNRITSATSPLSISSNALSLGTVPVANGGTGITTTPTNGQILIGNGTGGFALATLSQGTGVSITNGSGSITINASARSWTDQPAVIGGQTTFTLTYAPTANSKIWMFINGVRTNNNAYSFNGTTVTYVPASNGAYAITASDRVQFDYTY